MPSTAGTSPKSIKTLAFQAVYASANGLASVAERLQETAENRGFSAPARKASAQRDRPARRVSAPALAAKDRRRNEDGLARFDGRQPGAGLPLIRATVAMPQVLVVDVADAPNILT
jgi:hypothetical protein